MNTRLLDDELVDSLSAFAALPEWLADGMDGALIGHLLDDLADGGLRVSACTPERLRAKGEEWLARYRVEVVDPEGERREVVLVGNLWPPAAGDPPVDEPGTDRAGFGEPGWRCWLPEVRLELRAQEHDEALPALPLLVEPEAAAGLLRRVLPAAGYDAAVVGCLPDVVRYKPGSRCTVVVHVDYETSNGGARPPSPVVLKTHQGDKGGTAWEAMSALWDRQQAWRGSVIMAEPLAFLPEERILVQGPVPERCTLKDLARRAFAAGEPLLTELRDELTKTARALSAVHDSGAVYGRTATLDQEITEIHEVIDRLAHTVPKLEGAGAALMARLSDVAATVPADPVVAAHHDFRPAQVLLHEGRVGFIDFDGAAMAEPALDVGRFRAKLRDIGISALAASGQPMTGPALDENLRLQDELCDHFLAAYQEHAQVSATRVLLWETCDLFTAMLHAWTKVRIARLEPRLVALRHRIATSGLATPRP
ncbi:phosphotransferase [Nocardioides sp.]|uniref:phosphotransferase n=1 Tax=Nocardioides sp. TaxID=35761 RepID=UPI002ED098E9